MSIREKVHKKLLKKATSLNLPTPETLADSDVPTVRELVRSGYDPLHAHYIFIQNLTSVFSESVTQFPEFKAFAKIVMNAEDEYLPSEPPMSPLTTSYFTCWAFYDLRIDGNTTLGHCMMDANDLLRLTPDQMDALRSLADSRMGIYEQVGKDGSRIRLRELITETEASCHFASGYRGQTGDLCYVRMLPPLSPELGQNSVAFTTPYLLTRASKEDWTQFLKRAVSQAGLDLETNGLHTFLKVGPDPNYWHEFIFKSYAGHRNDAIILAGIPDRNETLPHG